MFSEGFEEFLRVSEGFEGIWRVFEVLRRVLKDFGGF